MSRSSQPSQRQLRVGEVVRRALSDALMRGDIHDPELSSRSITVTEVQLSPDLKIATAFVMPLGGEDHEGSIAALARNKGELRRVVAKETQLKFAPDLRFRIDRTFDRMDETTRMLNDPRVRRDVEAADDGEDGSGDGPGTGDA